MNIKGKKKLALFDFCDTLITFQSADMFVEYVLHNKPSCKRSKVLDFFKVGYDALPVHPWNIGKQLLLRQLRGFKEKEIDISAGNFYKEIILSNIKRNVYKKLKEHQIQGYTTVIISGGYTPYLKYFTKENMIDHCIATDIGFDGGVCTGKIRGLDCMNINKIKKLKEVIDLNEFDLRESFVYSDSKSDLPLFRLVGNAVVVTDNPNQNWITKNNFKMLIC